MQMCEDEEYGENINARMFSFAEETIKKKSLKDWLGWDDKNKEITNKENLTTLLSLFISNDDDSEPKITSAIQIRDFAKIIEIFDNHNASFVSITQNFNTTTSMGRLTLNILLSFAQFEREVTGERIRDKFEATRQKGLWIFGKPPYGYTKNEHNILIPEEPFATNIKQIFSSYLELKSVDKLQNKLKELNINSRTGKPFARGHLYKILSNKVYIGKLQHKDKEYEML